MSGTLSQTRASLAVDVADAILAAALDASADQIWIEPAPLAEERHLVTCDRHGAVLASTTLDGNLAAAVIARLAIVAEIDLAAERVQSGTVHVSGPSGERTCVVTVRPGAGLRCEVLLLPRRDPHALSGSLDPDAQLEPGVMIEHYRVRRFLGRGGMGAVYEVEHVALARRLALKALHRTSLAQDPDSSARFLREARAAARIEHRHIVQVYDFGHLPDGRPYIVMELLTGDSLGDHITRGELDLRRAVGIGHQAAAALAAAHEHGVVHADVSPSNIILAEWKGGLEVKLVDFGLAQLLEDRVEDPQHNQVFGTPHYISPEQLYGDDADTRSDMYSFGAVLFETITGQPPFDAEDVRALCLMHTSTPVPELRVDGEEVPPALAAIVRRCLAKTPAERFATMREVCDALLDVERSLDRRGWRRWLPR